MVRRVHGTRTNTRRAELYQPTRAIDVFDSGMHRRYNVCSSFLPVWLKQVTIASRALVAAGSCFYVIESTPSPVLFATEGEDSVKHVSSLTVWFGVLWLLFSPARACFPIAPPTPTPAASGHLIIGGSGSAYPLLAALTRAFTDRNPLVQVTFDTSSQTSSGIKAVAAGTYDVGAIARPLAESERLPKLREVWIARDAVVIAVHSKAKIEELSKSQVQAIYRGDVRSWAELGGSDSEIIVLDRAEGETAKIAMRQFVLGADLSVTARATLLPTEQDMFEAVANVPDTIGYFSMSYILSNGKVHPVRLDGVQPTLETLASGAYLVVRPIGIVVREDRAGAFPLREFLAFLGSSDAAAQLRKAGVVPEVKP